MSVPGERHSPRPAAPEGPAATGRTWAAAVRGPALAPASVGAGTRGGTGTDHPTAHPTGPPRGLRLRPMPAAKAGSLRREVAR
jgi:hypothetical protein